MCTDCAVSFGFVEAIDLGSDTMKVLELNRVFNNGGKNKNQQMREREKERFLERVKMKMYFHNLIKYKHQDCLYSIYMKMIPETNLTEHN